MSDFYKRINSVLLGKKKPIEALDPSHFAAQNNNNNSIIEFKSLKSSINS